jgi:hypothetical protein
MTATVTPTIASGNVTLYDGVQIIGAGPLVNGRAVFSTSSLPWGAPSIVARFAGSFGFLPSASTSSASSLTPVPSSGLAAPITQSLPFNLAATLVPADLNNDGISDLVLWAGQGDIVSLLGKGDGTFTPVDGVVGGGNSLVPCDLNGDGKTDLPYNAFNVGVGLGNGDGTFNYGPSFGQDWAISIACLDVNRDGRPDVAFISTDPSTNVGLVNVHRGNGDGTFEHYPNTYAAGTTPRALAVGDINNDGIADNVAIDPGTNAVIGLLGKADGTFAAAGPATIQANGTALTIADFNGDGLPDVAVAHSTQKTVPILLGNGDGTFQAPTIIELPRVPAQIFAVDMNGDGFIDLVTFYPNSTTAFSILYGNGDGTFQYPDTYHHVRTPFAMAIVDVNGDGRPDGAGLGHAAVLHSLHRCLPGSSVPGVYFAQRLHRQFGTVVHGFRGRPSQLPLERADYLWVREHYVRGSRQRIGVSDDQRHC